MRIRLRGKTICIVCDDTEQKESRRDQVLSREQRAREREGPYDKRQLSQGKKTLKETLVPNYVPTSQVPFLYHSPPLDLVYMLARVQNVLTRDTIFQITITA